MTIDAVVVTHDTRELTLRCVGSTLAANAGGGVQVSVTVVDNDSRDGTADAIEQRWPQVRVIRNAENVGYGRACNQGLEGGEGDLVLILNSDIIVRPGAIAALAGFLSSHPAHVAAGGRLVDPGTENVQVGHNVRAFPSLGAQAAQMLGLERSWPRNPLSRRYLMLDMDYDRTQDAAQPAGSCLAVRRREFEALGGFDEGFYYWYEDVDLVRRLHDRGLVAYVHDATFEHVGGATFRQWSRPESIETWYPSLFRYFDKHRPPWERVALRGFAAALAAVRMVGYAFVDRARARACAGVLRMAVRGTNGSR